MYKTKMTSDKFAYQTQPSSGIIFDIVIMLLSAFEFLLLKLLATSCLPT